MGREYEAVLQFRQMTVGNCFGNLGDDWSAFAEFATMQFVGFYPVGLLSRRTVKESVTRAVWSNTIGLHFLAHHTSLFSYNRHDKQAVEADLV